MCIWLFLPPKSHCNVKISSVLQNNKVEPHGHMSGSNLVLTRQGGRPRKTFERSVKYVQSTAGELQWNFLKRKSVEATLRTKKIYTWIAGALTIHSSMHSTLKRSNVCARKRDKENFTRSVFQNEKRSGTADQNRPLATEANKKGMIF